MENTLHKREIKAWTMYDWANSAFATTIMAAVLPVYYSSVASKGIPANEATSNWAFTTTIALVIVAILGPILGAMADFSGAKKRFMSVFVIIGVFGTLLLYFVRSGDWLMASIVYIIGSIGFSGANVFYDSFLPHIAHEGEIDQVSSRGYALGYAGGGIMLAINLAMIMLSPDHLTETMTRLSFVTVAVWWFIFTIPFWRTIKEPARRILDGERGFNPVKASFHRLSNTFKEIKKFKELSKFIVAFWLIQQRYRYDHFYGFNIWNRIRFFIYHDNWHFINGAICCNPVCIPVWLVGKKNWHQKRYFTQYRNLYINRNWRLFPL